MKTVAQSFFFLFINFCSLAQSNEFEIQKNIFERSKVYNDPGVSINALYKIMLSGVP